jgi:GT2 family glycosyltransferase
MSQSVEAQVVVVTPVEADAAREAAKGVGAVVLDDPGSLTGAINLGIDWGQQRYPFVAWLNDDDLLEPGSLEVTRAALQTVPDAVVAFGSCRYIDAVGRELWVSRAGAWAPRILKWGPDLVPQPGMLIRAQAWMSVGGLDESFRLAFDLDLLLRLQKKGRLIDVGQIVSSFRWHGDSLTVDDRTTNLKESERAKRQALGPVGRRLAWLWEAPMRIAIRAAVHQIQRRARRSGSSVAEA